MSAHPTGSAAQLLSDGNQQNQSAEPAFLQISVKNGHRGNYSQRFKLKQACVVGPRIAIDERPPVREQAMKLDCHRGFDPKGPLISFCQFRTPADLSVVITSDPFNLSSSETVVIYRPGSACLSTSKGIGG